MCGMGCLPPIVDSWHCDADGSAIEQTGFKYAVPEISEDIIRGIVHAYIAEGFFPPVLEGGASGGGGGN